MPPFDFRSPYMRRPWIRVSNTSGQVVPPFAVMKIEGATKIDEEIVVTVAQPTSADDEWYLVNGPIGIASGGEGWASTLTTAGYIKIDSGSPTTGQFWKAKASSWGIESGGDKFFIIGGVDNGAVVAIQQTAPEATNLEIIEFTLTETMGATLANRASMTITASSDPGLSLPAASTVFDYEVRWPDAITGCKGTAWKYSGEYRIISCTRAVREAKATLNADMCGTVPSVTGWTPVPLGEHQVDPGEGTLTNPNNRHSINGDVITFRRTGNTPPFTWEVIDVPLQTINVPVEWRFQPTACALQVLNVEVAVEACADVPEEPDEEDWVTILTMDEIDYLTGASIVSTSGCELSFTRAKMCGFAREDTLTTIDLVMTEIEPMVDWYVDGLAIKGTFTPAWVFCTDTNFDSTLHTGTDCPTE